MRVISGSARGHKLFTPKSLDIRPTLDRVKESVFNIINISILDATVLELFAGTGNLSIEALSRGAKESTLVDSGKESLQIINKNLEKTRLNNKAKVINSNVLAFLEKTTVKKYDFIFLDPPYNQGHVNTSLQAIDKNDILNKDGLVIIERHKDDFIEENKLKIIKVVREEKYGDTIVSFLSNVEY